MGEIRLLTVGCSSATLSTLAARGPGLEAVEEAYLKPKNPNELMRDDHSLQLLGSGWIALPDSP